MKLVIDGEYIAYHGIVVIYRKRRQHLYLGKTPQKNSDILKNNMMTLLLFSNSSENYQKKHPTTIYLSLV